jgi:anti-sigma B factor antagonist
MQINTRLSGSVAIVELSGELSLYNVNELKETFQKLLDEERLQLVLNLENLSYMDSSGIGVLIAHLTRLKKEGGGLRLCHLHDNVRTLLKLTKLHNLFQIFETEEEARLSFQ